MKANLRSVLDSEDEELEILPHVKGSTDFEVYEQVQIEPKLTVLPWDDNVKPNYTLTYKVHTYIFSKLSLKYVSMLTSSFFSLLCNFDLTLWLFTGYSFSNLKLDLNLKIKGK